MNTENIENSEEYKQGYFAAFKDECPYADGTTRANLWLMGFNEQTEYYASMEQGDVEDRAFKNRAID